jgi:hypothetical protein
VHRPFLAVKKRSASRVPPALRRCCFSGVLSPCLSRARNARRATVPGRYNQCEPHLFSACSIRQRGGRMSRIRARAGARNCRVWLAFGQFAPISNGSAEFFGVIKRASLRVRRRSLINGFVTDTRRRVMAEPDRANCPIAATGQEWHSSARGTYSPAIGNVINGSEISGPGRIVERRYRGVWQSM